MKTQIKEVQDYFKSKIFSQDFEISKISEYVMELIIDSEYTFTIWIGNINVPASRKQYDCKLDFMNLQLTDAEAIKLSELLLPAIVKFKNEILLIEKRNELEKLQSELSTISLI